LPNKVIFHHWGFSPIPNDGSSLFSSLGKIFAGFFGLNLNT